MEDIDKKILLTEQKMTEAFNELSNYINNIINDDIRNNLNKQFAELRYPIYNLLENLNEEMIKDEIQKNSNFIKIPNITVSAKFDSAKRIIVINKTDFLKDYDYITDENKILLNDCIYYYALDFSKCFLVSGICYTTSLNNKNVIFGKKFLINDFSICL